MKQGLEKQKSSLLKPARSFSQIPSSEKSYLPFLSWEKQDHPSVGANNFLSQSRDEQALKLHSVEALFLEKTEREKEHKESGKQKIEQIFKVPKTEELLHLTPKKNIYSAFASSSESSSTSLPGTEKILVLESKNLLAAPYISDKTRERVFIPSKKKQKKGFFSKSEEEFSEDEKEPSS